MKTPKEVQEEIEKLLKDNNCSFEIEIHDPKITVINKDEK